jgi:nicotinate-nucleotide adenylyltransferase
MSPAIGIIGGTFDPVHFGHLRAALEARELLQLDEIRLLPAGTPPHRDTPRASPEDRLNMLNLAVGGYPEFSVDDREVRRQGPSYMVDTLADFRTEAGGAPILLVIGQDAANELDSWHQWRSLFELAHLVIMRRPGAVPAWSGELRMLMEERLAEDADALHGSASGRVLSLQVTQLAISSTDIRQRLKTGRSPRFLMPESVIEYIEQNQLYFAGQPRKG